MASRNAANSNHGQPGDSFDEVDRGIIGLLAEDGRMPNRNIAQRLHLSEGTVRRRLKRLREKGLIKISAMVKYVDGAGYLSAYIGIKIKSRDLITAGQKISKLPWVTSVCVVAGQYDLITEVVVASSAQLIDFVTKELPSVGEVQTSETLLVLKTFNKWIAANGLI